MNFTKKETIQSVESFFQTHYEEAVYSTLASWNNNLYIPKFELLNRNGNYGFVIEEKFFVNCKDEQEAKNFIYTYLMNIAAVQEDEYSDHNAKSVTIQCKKYLGTVTEKGQIYKEVNPKDLLLKEDVVFWREEDITQLNPKTRKFLDEQGIRKVLLQQAYQRNYRNEAELNQARIKQGLEPHPTTEAVDLDGKHFSPDLSKEVLTFLLQSKIELPQKCLTAINNYKDDHKANNEPGFGMINRFMRSQDLGHSIAAINENLIDTILAVDDAYDNIAGLPFNLVAYRNGKNASSQEAGNTKNYESFVSVSYNRKAIESFDGDTYRFVIPQGERVIPIEQVEDVVKYGNWNGSECEILMWPAEFEVESGAVLDERYTDPRNILEMKKTRKNDVGEVIKKALDYHEKQYVSARSGTRFRDEFSELRQTPKYAAFLQENDKQLDLVDTFQKRRYLRGNCKDISKILKEVEQSENLFEVSSDHGVEHTKFVAFHQAMMLEQLDVPLDDPDAKAMIAAAKYHDIGRTHDFEDEEHGENSVEKLGSLIEGFAPKQQEKIRFLIREHSKPKSQNQEALEAIPDGDRPSFQAKLECFKDADKLDRVRISDLDPNRLETRPAKQMVKMAFEARDMLPELMQYEELIENTNDRLQERAVERQKQSLTNDRTQECAEERQGQSLHSKGIISLLKSKGHFVKEKGGRVLQELVSRAEALVHTSNKPDRNKSMEH